MEKRPLILAIDDDPFYLNEIKMEIEEHADYIFFKGPNDFEQNAKEHDVKNADLILVDYDYGRGTAVKSGIADYIRKELGYRGKLVLCSLHEDFKENSAKVQKDYDLVMHKRDMSWRTISQSLGFNDLHA